MQADILCFSEHNLATDQSQTRYQLMQTIKRHLPNSRIIVATSEIKSPSAYKPGGCLQIINNTIHSRITEQGSDRFGRWTFAALSTKHKSMIYIITVYKPCKNHQGAGPFTVYNQQWTMMRMENIQKPEPRQKFDTDLIDFIGLLQDKAHRIIVLGDFNETFQHSKLLHSLRNMGLVDTILSRHTNTPPFRSCNKGNNVIDFALCSPSILSCITSSAYEPFMINTMSDHRGIVIDFDTQELLGKHEHIVSPDKRGLNANNPIQVDKFLEALQKYWTKYDIKNRISNAMNNTKTTDIRLVVNSIDKDITKAMLKAERKVSKPNRPPWSPALKQASLLVKYYKLL